MVQPKYSPEEALERIKLMMKYDTSKTLNENVETINEALPAVLVPIVAWLTSTAGVSTVSAVGATGVGSWIYSVQGGGDSFSKAQTFFQGCSSLDAALKPLQDKSAHREAADSIYNAIQGAGTDEDAIRGAISSMESVADLCAMYKYYNKTYGDLYDDLDSDLDGESFRQYVWSAIAPIVEDAAEDLANAEEETPETEDGGNTGGGTGGGTGGYKDCSGSYSYGCKSPVIAKVQGCLGGLTTDGKFGPNTQRELRKKGYESFTDADVDKICGIDSIEDTDVQDVEGTKPNQI